MDFCSSYEKIKWAEKHVNDLAVLLEQFACSDLYSVTIEEQTWERGSGWLRNDLVITVNPDTPFGTQAALIIGDVLHNLRGALDLLYFQLVTEGTASSRTRFPITQGRQELSGFIQGALKQQQITNVIAELLMNTIKPYETGNPTLWALRELNDRDKHKLLIPTFKVMCISDIRLRNKEKIIDYNPIFTAQTCRKRLDDAIYGRYPAVENKGKAAAGIGFEFGIPFQGESVFLALKRITEEVTRTIETFEIALAPTI